jgi:DNA topoisomerase-1
MNVEGYEKKLIEIKYRNNTIDYKQKSMIVGSEKQKFVSTELGRKVVLFLTKYFPIMMDYKFTADLETKLDLIADGSLNHKTFIKEFYNNLIQWLSKIKN